MTPKMTVKKLEEFKKKFEENNGAINDIGEILIEFFFSSSSHMKEIKKELQEIKENQSILYNEIQEIKLYMNPIYTIISDDH